MSNQLVYGKYSFSDDNIESGNVILETDLSASSLAYDILSATVICQDRSIVNFTQNTPMTYYVSGRQAGTFYVQSIQPSGYRLYTITGISAVGRLTQMPHTGGLYTGETVEAVVKDICGTVPALVKSILKKLRLFGWLPYVKPPQASARDNLSQVLFAIGASLTTDVNGVLRVEPLFDGISNVVDHDRVYQDGGAKYDTPVSAVSVTEHQYSPGEDVETLFEGTAAANHIVTFSGPYSSLLAEGFTIQASGANWARLSAGTGVLTGKPYVHTTRLLTEPVTAGAAENVKSITNATLVSPLNSASVTKRMAEYYRHTEHIQEAISVKTERPGQVVSMYHPYDREMVKATIGSIDGAMSGIFKGETDALVGFIPTQPVNAEYFDHSEILTEDGVFVVPADVTAITAVCIGGGQAGWSGCRGGVSQEQGEPFPEYNIGLNAGLPGEGGAGGEPGQGGKIIQQTISVTPGQRITYKIGKGGLGVLGDADTSKEGLLGTDTVFGTVSSANGTPNPRGYTDILTGQVYGRPGKTMGIPGGTASGANPGDNGYQKGPDVIYGSQKWQAGNITDHNENELLNLDTDYIYTAQAGRGCGGGAAVGANGSDGTYGSVSGTRLNPVAIGGRGGNGANAVQPAKETRRGWGGTGGHGGGGEGGFGLAVIRRKGRFEIRHGIPGNGSPGGEGGDGVIILYYSSTKTFGVGQVFTRDKKFFFDRLGRLFVV